MNEIKRYSEAFRKQALEKVYTRGNCTAKAIAEELNINAWTLKNWMKSHQAQSTTQAGATSKRPNDWSPAERLEVLLASHGLDELGLNALCREYDYIERPVSADGLQAIGVLASEQVVWQSAQLN